ncbi:MAG: lasso RiPP family leader peptide-containing protein [Anaerolineae bacterium]
MQAHDKGQSDERAVIEGVRRESAERGRIYKPPRLTVLGRLGDVTLGSPFLTGDSGGSMSEHQPGP